MKTPNKTTAIAARICALTVTWYTGTVQNPARILVVDDEVSMRDFLRICLSRAGHTVEVAKNGEEAGSTLAAGEFDVVITDLRMPGPSGLDVLQMVKDKNAATEVIVVTAYATPETAIAAM